MNGAQVSSLLLLTDKLALKQYPPEAVEAIVRAAFPLMPRELIDLFVKSLAKFTPPPPPAAPPPGKPPPPPPGQGRPRSGVNRCSLNGHEERK